MNGQRGLTGKQPRIDPVPDRLKPKDLKAQTVNVPTKINGFRADELAQLQRTLSTEPGAAKFTLRARNLWIEGAQSINLVHSFHGMGREVGTRQTPFIQTTDTPQILLGKDLGPSPIEELLVALAGSVTTTLAYRASATNLTIQEIECDVEGDLNMHTAKANEPEESASFEQIRVAVRVKADASEEQLALFCKASPILNALINPIPVTVTVKKS